MHIEGSRTRSGAYVASVLVAGWLIAFMDRQLILILAPAIKDTLDISDIEFSLLYGVAFSAIFAVTGLFAGKLVDTLNRPSILVASIVGWSLMTVGCGLADSYTELLLARAGVGLCQALLAPASVSLLADLFSSGQRGRVTGALLMGAAFGAALAKMGGGWLLVTFADRPDLLALLPFELLAWQATLVIAGLLGVLVAPLFMWLPEPGRAASHEEQGAGLWPFFVQHWRLLSAMIAAFTLNLLVAYGTAAWFPAIFMRKLVMSPAEAGLAIGAIIVAVSPLAAFLGGGLSDRFAKIDPIGGRVRFARICLLIAPLTFVPLLLPSSLFAVAFSMAASVFVLTLITSTAYTLLPELVPPSCRGRMIAVFQFVGYLLGLALGPTIIALITDHVLESEAMVDRAMVMVAVPGTIAAFAIISIVMPKAIALRREMMAGPAIEPLILRRA